MRRTARGWLPALCLLLAAAGGCQREASELKAPLLLPHFAQAQHGIDRLLLRGAGNVPRVTLVKRQGEWQVLERGGWPADAGRISRYLFLLSQARRAEAKTVDPKLYPRLGVEPVAGARAAGTELELSGGGTRARLLIGNEHPKFDAHYVRVDGEAASWLTDLPVAFDGDPAAWLDRRLLDQPLARIESVQVSDANGARFSLSHRDDRFRLDDAPSGAMRESRRGDELAAALDQLQLEDVAAGGVAGEGVRQLLYGTVDGMRFTLRCWPAGGRTWMTIEAGLDEAKAASWFAASDGKAETPDTLRSKVARWNARFASRRFLMPEATARSIWLDHAAILAGEASP